MRRHALHVHVLYCKNTLAMFLPAGIKQQPTNNPPESGRPGFRMVSSLSMQTLQSTLTNLLQAIDCYHFFSNVKVHIIIFLCRLLTSRMQCRKIHHLPLTKRRRYFSTMKFFFVHLYCIPGIHTCMRSFVFIIHVRAKISNIALPFALYRKGSMTYFWP